MPVVLPHIIVSNIINAKKVLDPMSQIWDITIMKLAVFHPKARQTLREFPEDIRREFGKAIFDLQKGEKLKMPLSKPMPSVAVGVEELRLKDSAGAYRVFYYTRLENSVLIFHGFIKKTQKTPIREIRKGQKYLKEMTT